MFTSRAEYRLMLREDNADLRLTEVGRELGVVDDVRWEAFNRKRDAIAHEQERLNSMYVSAGFPKKLSGLELLRRPEVSYADVLALAGGAQPLADPAVAEQVEIQAKYHGYIERQRGEVERRKDLESLRLPGDFDYRAVRGLSAEVQQMLDRHRPETIGQASRISGVTPAAISLLLVYLKRGVQLRAKKRA